MSESHKGKTERLRFSYQSVGFRYGYILRLRKYKSSVSEKLRNISRRVPSEVCKNFKFLPSVKVSVHLAYEYLIFKSSKLSLAHKLLHKLQLLNLSHILLFILIVIEIS